MEKFNSISTTIYRVIILLLLATNISYAKGIIKAQKDLAVRASFAYGPRVINSQVTSSSRFDFAQELGLGIYSDYPGYDYYYGADIFSNSNWVAMFDSLNGANPNISAPLNIYNTTSFDIVSFIGRKLQNNWAVEGGAGVQMSWVKWIEVPMVAESEFRIVPKIRLTILRKISRGAQIFLSFNQSFNSYEKLQASSGNQNTFNGDGFVSVSDLKLGISLKVY